MAEINAREMVAWAVQFLFWLVLLGALSAHFLMPAGAHGAMFRYIGF